MSDPLLTFRDHTSAREASDPARPSFFTTLGAALRRETTLGSALTGEGLDYGKRGSEEFEKPVPPEYFDALEPKYQAHAPRFVGLTLGGAEALKRNIDAEMEDAETLDRAGFLGSFVATLAVQPLDPVNYLPFTNTTFRGASFTQKLKRGAAAGLAGGLIQEPLLYATQETRTVGESAINVGASVVFGMALGGAAHAFDAKFRDQMAKIDSGQDVLPTEARDARARDLSAAVNDFAIPTAPDLEVIGRAQGNLANWTPDVLSPVLRLGKAASLDARKLGFELIENFLQLGGADSGKVGRAVETAIKTESDAMRVLHERGMSDGFQEWLKETNGPGRLRPVSREKARTEFGAAVGRALRRGDVDPESEAVTATAKRVRSEILAPMLKRAQDVGLLPEGLTTKTALSYFRRAWNPEILSARQREFENIVSDWFREGIESGQISRQDFAQMRLAEAEARLRDATEDTGTGGPSQAQIDDATKELSAVQAEVNRMPKQPVIQALKSVGGLRTGTPLHDELKHLGVNARTVPGLFRKNGLADIDNLVHDELWELADRGIRTDGNYFDRNDLLEAIADELRGTPRRTIDELDALDRLDALARFTEKTGTGPGRKAIRDLEDSVQRLRADAAKADIDLENLDPNEVRFYAREAARGTWNTLTGRDGGFESPIVAAVQGPLKGRTLMIPDERVEQFLNDDAHNVLEQYIRTMTAEIAMTEKFGRADLRDQIGKVQDEYSELKEGKSEAEARALDKERDKVVETIEAARDILRGTYMADAHSSNVGSIARGSNAFNFVRMLGDVVLSSFPDMFRSAQVHGFQNLLGTTGMRSVMKSIKALQQSPHQNFLRREAELAGIAEAILNSRVQAMADLHDPYAGSGPVESTMRALSNIGSMASGMPFWNQFWKQTGFQLGVTRMDRIAQAGDNIAARDRKWLRSLKVSTADMDRIARQMRDHSTKRDGLVDPMTETWTDPYAVRAFREALRADVDSIIVTPGLADKPLVAYHPVGALALQFKSFFLAAHNRALMRGLGEDQTDFLTGAALMVSLGMATYYLKSLSGNFEASDNPGVWLAEGIDRSGVLSVPMEVNNMMEPFLNRAGAGGVYTGLSAAMGDSSELSSRYRFRRDFIGETLLGPSASTVKDMGTITGDLLKQGITGEGVDKGTAGAGARMLPFANHPGIKQMMRYFAIPKAKEWADG